MQLLKDLFRKKTVGGICLVILILFLFLAIFADVGVMVLAVLNAIRALFVHRL